MGIAGPVPPRPAAVAPERRYGAPRRRKVGGRLACRHLTQSATHHTKRASPATQGVATHVPMRRTLPRRMRTSGATTTCFSSQSRAAEALQCLGWATPGRGIVTSLPLAPRPRSFGGAVPPPPSLLSTRDTSSPGVEARPRRASSARLAAAESLSA